MKPENAVSISKKQLLICPIIHWDREWFSNEVISQEKLVLKMEQILSLIKNDPNYPAVYLDGQVGIIRDYLEKRPDKKEFIEKLIKEKKITLGIWYFQPDVNIPNGEVTIRNLLLGKKELESYGISTHIGYLPDSFGHFAQLPQILKGFGIDSYYFGRGLGDEGDYLGLRFMWVAPDNSYVYAFHIYPSISFTQDIGYDENGSINYEYLSRHIKKVVEIQDRFPNNHINLITVRDPTSDLPEFLRRIKEIFLKSNSNYTNLEDILPDEEYKHLKVYRGELRQGKFSNIFTGTYTNRIPIKIAYLLAETKTLKLLEPLCVFSEWLGKEAPKFALYQIWHNLLKNTFHDTICGTGIDSVYNSVVTRLNLINDLSDCLIEERFSFLTHSLDTATDDCYIAVYNPHPYNISYVIQKEICLPANFKSKNIYLVDFNNNPISASIIDSQERYENDDLRFPRHTFAKIVFFARDLPPCGLRYYRIRLKPEIEENYPKSSEEIVSDKNIRIDVNKDGTLDIFQNSKLFTKNIGYLIDDADIGDLYNSETTDEPPIRTKNIIPDSIEKQEFHDGYQITILRKLLIPYNYVESLKCRSKSESINSINTEVFISKYEPIIEYRITIENCSKDHRLRIAIPTGIKSSSLIALRQFNLEQQPISKKQSSEWVEQLSPEQFHNGMIWIHDSEKSLAILTQGIYGYYPEIDEYNGEIIIYLTISRSVGWLSRLHISKRSSPAGPCVPTEAAQLLSQFHIRFAILIGESDPINIIKRMEEHNCPPIAFQPNFLSKARLLSKPWRVVPHDGNYAFNGESKIINDVSFCNIQGYGLFLSGLKKAEDNNGYVARIYNILDKSSHLVFKTAIKAQFWTSTMDEQEDTYLGEGYQATMVVNGHQIISLLFRPSIG